MMTDNLGSALTFQTNSASASVPLSGVHVAAREAVQRAQLPQRGAQRGPDGPGGQHGRGRLQSQNPVGQRHEWSVSAA